MPLNVTVETGTIWKNKKRTLLRVVLYDGQCEQYAEIVGEALY